MAMRTIVIAGLLCLALVLGVLVLGTSLLGPSVLEASAEEPKNILATMERVADWELAHADSAAVPPSSHKTTDPLDWVTAAFYVGLTALAERSSNPLYGEVI